MSNVSKTYSSIGYYARYGEQKTFDRDGKPEHITGDGQYEQFVVDGLKTELSSPLTGIEDPRFKKFLDKKVLKEMKQGDTIKIGQDEWKVDKAGAKYTIDADDILPSICMGAIWVPLIYVIERIEGFFGGGMKELHLSSKAQCVEKNLSSPASYFNILYAGEKYSEIWLSSRFNDGEFLEEHIVSTKFNVKTGEYHKNTMVEEGRRYGYR